MCKKLIDGSTCMAPNQLNTTDAELARTLDELNSLLAVIPLRVTSFESYHTKRLPSPSRSTDQVLLACVILPLARLANVLTEL